MDDEGRVHDWADRPASKASPTYPPLLAQQNERQKKKRSFTQNEELLLLEWCTAAERQGLLIGVQVYEELECIVRHHLLKQEVGRS